MTASDGNVAHGPIFRRTDSCGANTTIGLNVATVDAYVADATDSWRTVNLWIAIHGATMGIGLVPLRDNLTAVLLLAINVQVAAHTNPDAFCGLQHSIVADDEVVVSRAAIESDDLQRIWDVMEMAREK